MENKGIGMSITTLVFGAITSVALVLFFRIKNDQIAVEDVGELIAALIVGGLGLIIFGAISIVGAIITGIFFLITIIIIIRYYSKKKSAKSTTTYTDEPTL